MGVPNYTDFSVGAAYDLNDGLSLRRCGRWQESVFRPPSTSRLLVTLTKPCKEVPK